MEQKPGPMSGNEQQMPQQGGGAAQMVADIHSNLLKLSDLVGSKFPKDNEKLMAIIQGFQSFVDGLGQAPGEEPDDDEAMPQTTTPQAGAAKVQPVM